MPRVYLSSTFTDLETHRQAALKAILSAGFDCSAMEHYAATDERPVEVCLEDVARCEVYVGLFAHRSGFVPPGYDRSITELEYRAAKQGGKTVLLFLVDETHPWLVGHVDEGEAKRKLVALKAEMTSAHLVTFFKAPDDLAARVSAALARLPRSGSAPVPAPLLPRSNLPSFADTPFVGRVAELEAVGRLFTDGAARLVTVTGTGGIGKTHFACEAARRLLGRFEGRCYFIDLSEQQTVTGVSNAVAEALGRRLEQAGEPGRLVADMLASLPPLLAVLDNFEQVVGHAARTVGLWRQAVPEVRFLVTSRKLLDLPGEYHYRLAPLAPPDAADAEAGRLDALSANETVQLFVDRAARRKPGFALTAANARDLVAICHKLDRHPLSLVLVAQRVKDFPPHQLLERLQHRFELVKSGERTLWKTLDWSYQLLRTWERQAFVQACIFRDGFSLEAAEAVLQLDGLPPDVTVMDAVQGLCDHSLLNSGVLHDEARFGMFTTVQEFGQRQWGDGGAAGPSLPPADLARRWAAFYADLAGHWDAQVHTPLCREALDRLVAERENVLAAHQWALQAGAPVLAARLILAYARALKYRGPWNLRLPRLTETLDRLGDLEPVLRVRLLIELSKARWSTGGSPEAHQTARTAAAEAARAGDRAVHAHALREQGRTANEAGERDEALRCFEASIALCREASDDRGVALNHLSLGNVYDRLGRYVEALDVLDKAERVLKRLQDPLNLSHVANVKGLALWHEGRPAEAVPLFVQAEGINRDLGDITRAAARQANRGLALTDLDRYDEALACFDESDRVHFAQGNWVWQAINQTARGQALLQRGDVEAARDCLEQALQASEKTGYRENIAFAAGCLGRALLALGRTAEALPRLRQAVGIQREIDKASNRRVWSNLIHLARAEREAGDATAAGPLLDEALQLAERLRLWPDHALRTVREDWDWLNRLRGETGTEGPQ